MNRLACCLALVLTTACFPDVLLGRDSQASTSTDGATALGGSSCGTATCGAAQLCVHPCCGGAPAQCVEASDAGTCAFGPCSRPGSVLPCAEAPCTPPPPYCVDLPTSCGGAASCGCLPTNVCQGAGSCGVVDASGVACVCA